MRVTTPEAGGRVHLHGAHITHYQYQARGRRRSSSCAGPAPGESVRPHLARAAVTFEEALHPYVAVGDVRQVAATGLAGRTSLDKTAGLAPTREGFAPIRLTRETDRVYLDARGPCVVDDPVAGRRLVVEPTGSAVTVLWNPWAPKAHALPDLGDDAWPGMLCVETAHTADPPGGTRRRRPAGPQRTAHGEPRLTAA